jgi:hypothetical protein
LDADVADAEESDRRPPPFCPQTRLTPINRNRASRFIGCIFIRRIIQKIATSCNINSQFHVSIRIDPKPVALERDYRNMGVMLFGEPPPFATIIETLTILAKWDFYLLIRTPSM